ncbi:glutamate--cysteine ligase [Aeromicrobium sp. NPDC092404]|uniref:carboxylate-amine ligase n=1 Tax=Aeromicrobium sp. NPDC092404 TaxID=3154976 RepID=UPI003431C63E
MTLRQVGVEEEMFLIDPRTRQLAPVSDDVVHSSREAEEGLDQELFLQQIETASRPQSDLAALKADLIEQRRRAAGSADAVGATVAAVATPVLADPHGIVTPKERYHTMLDRFGEIRRQGLVCATHVHVSVEQHEVIGIIDDVRPWLPLLMAVSANSPYAEGVDTGYASWRGQLWDAWPSAGPVEPFGDLAGYRDAVRELVGSGAALDEAMVYFDARVARSYPTVEIRVADVCTNLDDTVLVAELARALVETLARERARGSVAEGWRVELLRAARWRARRHGLADSLLDPVTRAVVPAEKALSTLLEHLRPVLDDHGTTSLVEDGIRRLLVDGTGADRQRAVAGRSPDLTAVVDDLVRRTQASFDD